MHHLVDYDTKEWNVDLLHELIVADDVSQILSLRISKSGCHDGYSWNHTNSGCYTVKSDYTMAVEQRKKAKEIPILAPNCNILKKQVWKVKAPRKIKHFLWQALSGYVASACKLKERHCGTDTVCQARTKPSTISSLSVHQQSSVGLCRRLHRLRGSSRVLLYMLILI